MSALITTLGTLKSIRSENEKRQAERDRPKANWFKPVTNQSVKVKFLQELSTEVENYDATRGTFLGAVEHMSPGPKGYMSRALCTLDEEGKCFACERHMENPREGWAQKKNFYINVLVQHGTEKPQVEIMSRNMLSPFIDDLVDLEAESEGKGLTAATYVIKRTGSGPQTLWKIKESRDEVLDDSNAQVFKLEDYAIRTIPYEEQRAYYMRNYEAPEAPVAAAAESAPGDADSAFQW
jgi:hypothetical protein